MKKILFYIILFCSFNLQAQISIPIPGGNSVKIFTISTGSPEGIIRTNAGSFCLSQSGSAWLKTTSNTNTGWLNIFVTATTFSNTGTANGLTVTNGAINLNAANYSNPGGVSTGSQTFGGPKTFRTDAEGGSLNQTISNHLVTEDGEYMSVAYANATTQLAEESVRFKGTNSSSKEEYVRSNGSLIVMSNLNGQTKTIETYGWRLDGGTQITTGSTLNATDVTNRDGKYIFAGAGSILELPAPTTVAIGTSFEWVVTFTSGTNARVRNVSAGTDNNFVSVGSDPATAFIDLPAGRASGKITCMSFSGAPLWYVTIYN